MKRKALKIRYDRTSDIVTIDGAKYSGDFFRHFALLHPMPGPWVRVLRNEHGNVVLEQKVEGLNDK